MSPAKVASRIILALLYSAPVAAQPPQAVLDSAKAAFQKGDLGESERQLDALLAANPDFLAALILKGAVLDQQRRYAEAETCYQRALKIAPDSPQVLNNSGNHFLATGDRSRARELYRKALAIDPSHQNANLQLARIYVEDRQGAQALVYLARLDPPTDSEMAVTVLRARALALSGRCGDAAGLLKNLSSPPEPEAALLVSEGLTLAECKRFADAEQTFAQALNADPTNFEILYNLGLAALENGQTDRAAGVLETALQQRPEDADCLFVLARARLKQQRLLDAAALLARAQRQSPQRSDVLLLLAQVSFGLQFYEDAAAVYTRYLKLQPQDDIARRERGMALACANEPAKALSDLQWYMRKHPRDANGFYEAAIAQYFADRRQAFTLLDHAITLDPSMLQARYTRAVLNLEEKKPREALADLRLVVDREPENYPVLVHLGQAYLEADRPSEAAEILKRAVALSPDQPAALIHYRRALEQLGRKQEAAEVLARLHHTDSRAQGRRPQAGLIDYLSLPPAQQRARYLDTLRTASAANPSDARWKIRLAHELLASGNTDEAGRVFRELLAANLDPQTLAECGRILVDFSQYEMARSFLEKAVAADPPSHAARLDLAAALFHLQGPEAALKELDQTPAPERKGDFYLLRAQLLDALGEMQPAVDALNRGIAAAPTKPALYLQAAGFLLKHKLYHEALDLLKQAARVAPADRELLLAQAVTLDLLRREPDAQALLASMQARWPEWNRPYLLSGILLEIQLQSAQARQALETAIALGAATPEAYYYLAQAILHAAPGDLESAQDAIEDALALTSNDPYIHLLAGKISLGRKEYPGAIQHFREAEHLEASLIPAHYGLRDAYKALGDKQKAAAELEEIKRIAQENPPDDRNPFSALDFLFAVR